MDTLLLAYERATNMTEIAGWANALRGKEAPGAPGLRVIRVVRFQILDKGEYYTALILVEVSDLASENQVALKEADMVEIEQITSGIEDVMSNQAPSSEQEM